MMGDVLTIELCDEAASERFAKSLARYLTPGLLLTFCGEIGTGKTSIIRAMLRELGVSLAIKSPTFSLVESYNTPSLKIHHFDLYRIQHEEELEYIGLRDYFMNNELCLIEWPEHGGSLLPQADIQFNLIIRGAGRLLQITARSDAGKKILVCLAGV